MTHKELIIKKQIMKTKNWLTVLLVMIVQSILIAQTTAVFDGKQYFYLDNQWKLYKESDQQFYPLVEGTITLKYVPNTNQDAISGFEEVYDLTFLRKAVTGWYDYELDTTDFFTKVNNMSNEIIVENLVIPIYGTFFSTPDDLRYFAQWALNQANGININMENAWDITTGDSNVVIAILDTGVNWMHQDLGKGTDGYENIFNNPGEDPWMDENDPQSGDQEHGVGGAVDNEYLDDWKGWDFEDDDNNPMDEGHEDFHGTHVAGIVAAKTNNGTGIAGIAGGWHSEGVKVLPVRVGGLFPNGLVLDNAIEYAVDLGAKVIQLSLEAEHTPDIDDAIALAESNNVVIVCASGNAGDENVSYPASHPYVIAVGATKQDDFIWEGSSFGNDLFMSAPGKEIWSTADGNFFKQLSGTSHAAPMVSGVTGLMYSINEFLSPAQIKEILRLTADKVGGYLYYENPDNPGHSYELGYGRLNAFKAVQEAANMYSETIDLYMRDTYDDLGYDNPTAYPFTWDYDDGPDIWVRNQDDGLEIHEHENPEYNENEPVYVYVRVGNMGSVANNGIDEQLDLYWTVASTSNAWPDNFDGTNDFGDSIGSVDIPVLQPGESCILSFEWYIDGDSGVGNDWASCLLARIEGCQDDPIIEYPNQLEQLCYQNNNVTLKNCIVTNYSKESKESLKFYIGNPLGTAENFDIVLRDSERDAGQKVSEAAEISLIFDDTGWNLIKDKLTHRTDVKVSEDQKTFSFTDTAINLDNIHFPANTRVPVRVKYNFLTDKVTEKNSFKFDVVQKYTTPHPQLGDHWVGGIHFTVKKGARDLFDADAGEDLAINAQESVTISAEEINELAIYNWYDENANLIYTGEDFTVSPDVTKKYQLEVIADIDGFKDFDEVQISVNPFVLGNLVPNPTTDSVTISYQVGTAQSAYLMIYGVNNSESNQYIIDVSSTQTTIDVTSYPTGLYTVILICDANIIDAKSLIKE